MELEAKHTLKVNTKVVPHKKTINQDTSFDTCRAWNDIGKDQGFLYVAHHFDNGTIYLSNFPFFTAHPKTYTAVYHIDDITLYKEPTKPTELKKNQDSVKVGEIYESTITNNIYYVTEIKDNYAYGFGFDAGGKEWFSVMNIFPIINYEVGDIRLGSKSKWYTLLLNECEKRGLTDGTYFKSLGSNGKSHCIDFKNIRFDYETGTLFNATGQGILMKQDEWANPIISIDIENADEIATKIPTFKSMSIIGDYDPLNVGVFTGTAASIKKSEDVKPIINNPFKIGDIVEFLRPHVGIPKGIYHIENIKNNTLFFSGLGYIVSFKSINLDIMKLVTPINDTVIWIHGIKYTIGDWLHFKKSYLNIPSGLYTIKKISGGFMHFSNGKVLAISCLHNPEVIRNLSFDTEQLKASKIESLLDKKTETTNNKKQLIKLKTKFKL